MTPHRVRCVPGAAFHRSGTASRPLLGGAHGPHAETFIARLAASLGDETRLLVGAGLVVDADACTFDGRTLRSVRDWEDVIASDALARVDGAFALAWVDSHGTLFLARDPIGHRTLYCVLAGDTLVFATTVRALLDAKAADRRIRLRSVAAYLSYAYVPEGETITEGVRELLPGECLSFSNGVLERRAFWDLPAEPTNVVSEADFRQQLRGHLENAVVALLPDRGPVAASLSGGIDSSLVVALARRLSADAVHTFSITFGAEYRDELAWSSLVAEHCGTTHTIVELTPEAIVAHLDHTIACLDKPNGDPLTVPNALLFRVMADASSVALNGEGGDPCFGGPKNVPMVLSSLYDHGDDSGHHGVLERNYLRAHLKCFDDLGELLTTDTFAAACVPPLEAEIAHWFSDPRWHGLVSKLMAINTRFKGGHHILPKVDALSAPFSIAARSPLFMKSVVELAFEIPPELKLRGTDEKYLLKESVADILPRAILDRPKSGMLVPVEGWFQGPLLPEARARILDGLAPLGLFNRAYLEKLLSGKLGGLRPRRGVKIWLLVALEAHLRALGLTRA